MNTELPIQMFPTSRGGARQRFGPANDATFMFRLPQALKDKLVAFAFASRRGSNEELLIRLEASFENQSIDEHGVIVEHCPALRK